MRENIIYLGKINLDWHFAKGHYTCNCSTIEETDSFDRVICGILYKSGRQMAKSEIAALMGLNYTYSQTNNRYADVSEVNIFNNALQSAVNYKLVVEDGQFLQLTDTGRLAFETRQKSHFDTTEVELWADEFSDNKFSNKLFQLFRSEPVVEIHPEWNTLVESPRDVLCLQRNDLVDGAAGKSVLSMSLLEMEYYISHVECVVAYDLAEKRCYVLTNTGDDELNDTILGNDDLQQRLLGHFFSDKTESILLKSRTQMDLERKILELAESGSTEGSLLLSPESFYQELKYDASAISSDIVFFSVPALTQEFMEMCMTLGRRIVCVDYLEGDYDDDFVIENKICYRRVKKLRTSDVMVAGGVYYSTNSFVVEYDGCEYSIDMFYRSQQEKYIQSRIYSPFGNHIIECAIEMGKECMNMLKRNPAPNVFNDFLSLCQSVESLSLTDSIIDLDAKNNELTNVVDRLHNNWLEINNNRLCEIQNRFIEDEDYEAAVEQLDVVVSDVRNSFSDDDLDAHIAEVIRFIEKKQRKQILTINKQIIYILDTSAFMNVPQILMKFNLAKDKVVVPRAMEQELDRLAHDAARRDAATAALQQLRGKMVDYPHFVSIKDRVDLSLLPQGFDKEKADNHMLAAAIEFAEKEQYERIIIVSNDNEFRQNVEDCVASNSISDIIEAIKVDELLMRLGV